MIDAARVLEYSAAISCAALLINTVHRAMMDEDIDSSQKPWLLAILDRLETIVGAASTASATVSCRLEKTTLREASQAEITAAQWVVMCTAVRLLSQNTFDSSTLSSIVFTLRPHASMMLSADIIERAVSDISECVNRLLAVPRIAELNNGLRFIQTHFRRHDVLLSHVSHYVHMSPSQFDRLLIRHTGRGFRRHVRELRMNEARSLLLRSGCSIKEISYRVGYASQSGFCREFKRYFGRCPSQIRAAH